MGTVLIRRRKRPEIIAGQLREKIIAAQLRPLERVPASWYSPEILGASRGTTREALKILEFQGLITSKTGPGGGIFVCKVSPDNAMKMLENLFLFKAPSISDIYTLRKQLEPELAACAAGKPSSSVLQELQTTIVLYEDEPQTAEEEYRQRLAELDFHGVLARNCQNALLGFVCQFLVSLLQDMSVCRAIYRAPNPALRETGLHYQIRLLRAIKAGNAKKARQIMQEHMEEAEKYMLERAAIHAPVKG